MTDIAPKKNHLPQLNIIRAVASLAVAMYHLGGKSLPVLHYGWLGVQMFFVLTGFVICWALPQEYSIKKFGTFIAKRIIRIEPPYIASIIFILIYQVCILHAAESIQYRNLLFHLAYLNNFIDNKYLSPVYWTLGIEFQFYILIGLTFPVLLMTKYHAVSFLILLNSITYFIKFQFSFLFNFFGIFSLGILIFLYKRGKINKTELSVLLCLNVAHLYFNTGEVQTMVAVFTGSIILFLSKSNVVVDFFSRISFSLYLTHDLVGSQLVKYLGNLFTVKTVFTKAFAFSTGLGVAIGFAYIFYIFIEKPSLTFSKKLSF